MTDILTGMIATADVAERSVGLTVKLAHAIQPLKEAFVVWILDSEVVESRRRRMRIAEEFDRISLRSAQRSEDREDLVLRREKLAVVQNETKERERAEKVRLANAERQNAIRKERAVIVAKEVKIERELLSIEQERQFKPIDYTRPEPVTYRLSARLGNNGSLKFVSADEPASI